MDDEPRWDTARRLLHEDTLGPESRLTGPPLLLYAQWPTAISRLTVDHIEETDEAVRSRFGAVPVKLPAPVVEHAFLAHFKKRKVSTDTCARPFRVFMNTLAFVARSSGRTRPSAAGWRQFATTSSPA
ncbi:hypothetical protein [Actinacidiphila sp. bgisy160]|uniref:hypothetical protein n=1 Tax=Actinacidiphila sp. bgisy160 TaxID=3413796 RepID=UPI003D74F222